MSQDAAKAVMLVVQNRLLHSLSGDGLHSVWISTTGQHALIHRCVDLAVIGRQLDPPAAACGAGSSQRPPLCSTTCVPGTAQNRYFGQTDLQHFFQGILTLAFLRLGIYETRQIYLSFLTQKKAPCWYQT
jgi:hypothetical protein